MKIAIRSSQKINSRIHNSRIAIWQRIAQQGINMIGSHCYIIWSLYPYFSCTQQHVTSAIQLILWWKSMRWVQMVKIEWKHAQNIRKCHFWFYYFTENYQMTWRLNNTWNFLSHTQRQVSYQILLLAVDFMLHFKFLGHDWTIEYLPILHSADQYIHICPMSHTQWHSPM